VIMGFKEIKERYLTEKMLGKLASYCSLASLALLSASLLQFNDIKLGPYGLIHDLPPLYYVAVGVSLFSGFVTASLKEKRDLLQAFNYIVLLAALWLLPIIFEGTPRFDSAYKTIGFVEYIYREGRLEPSNWELFYHNWPGFSLFFGAMWLMGGMDEIYPLVQYYPFLLHLIMLVVLFWLFRLPVLQIQAPNAWYLGGVFYLLANFINQDYFCPQSMAYFLLSVLITLLVDRSRWLISLNRALGYKISVIIILIALALSHILSSLVALGLVVIFSLFDRKTLFNLVLLGIVVILAWNIYGAEVYFETHSKGITGDMFNVKEAWNSNVDNRVKGSPEHIMVNKIRIIYAASMGMCGFGGFLLALRKMDRKVLIELIKVSTVSVCIAGAFVYGGESFMRAYLFLLLPLSFFALGYGQHRKLLVPLFIFCALAVPFKIIAHYGNEQVDYISPGIIRGSDFLAIHSSGGYVVGYQAILGNTKNTEKFITLQWEQFNADFSPEKNLDDNYYIGIGPREKNYWSIFYNDPHFTDEIEAKFLEDRRFVLFYSNGEINLYYIDS